MTLLNKFKGGEDLGELIVFISIINSKPLASDCYYNCTNGNCRYFGSPFSSLIFILIVFQILEGLLQRLLKFFLVDRGRCFYSPAQLLTFCWNETDVYGYCVDEFVYSPV